MKKPVQTCTHRGGKRVIAIALFWTCLAYLAGLIVATILLWTLGDRWWPATVLLFAPRSIMALPMAVLLPLALTLHRRSLITLVAAGAMLAWPVMGLRIPFHTAPTDTQTPFIRVVTCNIHRNHLSKAEFKASLDSLRPDVVALQDWSSDHQDVLFTPGIWNCRRDDELFIASRWPISSTARIVLGEPAPSQFKVRLGTAAYYRLLTPLGPVSVINLHLASPHEALQAMREGQGSSPDQLAYNIRCRDMESATIEQFASQLKDPFVILGDFNTPRESVLYRHYWEQFTNAFSAAGFGFGSTHVSAASSVRIDHILLGEGWETRSCWLGQPAGSPHRPLVADLQLAPSRDAFASGAEP